VYRDCFNGQAPYDAEASLGVFDDQGNLVQNVLVPINDSSYVPNAINTPCLTPPLDICDQVAHYYTTVTLPPVQGGYTIAYQRCCRNYSCLNIFQFTGATYTCEIPDQQYAADDNPVYNNLPPTFICANAPFTFDHSATDADGDSLVYSLYTPYDGADQTTPQPSPPAAPPYNPIVFQSPYSLANVMGGVPMEINPQTGLLTATPSDLGQYVYGILVQEFRNGVLIGESRRDFQVNVTYCANYTVASIFSPTLVCGTLDAHFLNTSYGASTYSWTFGDPTTSNDTSTLMNPNYTYPDTGRYPLMLIAYAANPDCNDTAWGEARVYPPFFSRFGLTHLPCTDDFQFLDSSYSLYSNPNYWHWNFGDNTSSGVQSPWHHYSSSGNYTVTLIASADSGCTDTASFMVHAEPVPTGNFNLTLDTCAHIATFNNSSQGNSSSQWFFGDGNFSSSESPQHNYMIDGNVTAYLVVTNDSGCTDTAQVTFNLPQVPVADFTWDVLPCDSLVHFHNLSINSPSFTWTFGDNTAAFNADPTHMYVHSGSFTVTMQALGTNLLCTDHISKTVYVNRTPRADFEMTLDTCAHTATFNNLSVDGSIYHWYFGDGNFSSDENPQHIYMIDGNVTAYMIASNDSGCSDTSQMLFDLPQVPIANFTWDVLPCDSLVHFHNLSINSPSFTWTFGDQTAAFNSDPTHMYVHTGAYTVSMQALGTNLTCTDHMTQTVYVNRQPLADFTLFLDTCSFRISSTNYSTDATHYHWNFSDGFIDQSTDAEHYYSSDGNISVQLIAENDSGCSDTASMPATIPPLPISDFAWAHTDCDSLVTFTEQSQNAVAYRWLFGDGESNDDPQAEHIYHIAGDIPVKLVSTSQYGCRDTAGKDIHIIIRTPADFNIFVDSCAGEVYFNNNSPIAVYYDWNFGDQTASTEKNPVHVYKENGKDYVVTFTVNKESNCQEYIQKTLHYEVNEGEIVYVPNSFTPNGDGLNDVFELSLWKPCDIYSINIFDRWGHSVYSNDDAYTASWDGTFKGHLVPEDVYVYVLEGSHLKKTGYVLLIK